MKVLRYTALRSYRERRKLERLAKKMQCKLFDEPKRERRKLRPPMFTHGPGRYVVIRNHNQLFDPPLFVPTRRG